tara:strand:- start:1552 stop:1851 length:300 start_codon:yes stop_codon:yes gene_type:complete
VNKIITMKKLKNYLLIAISIVAFSSCTITTPVLVTDNVVGEKTGVAEVKVFLGIFGPLNKDISIKKAAENGKITEIGSVDYAYRIGLFKSEYKTIVTGR